MGQFLTFGRIKSGDTCGGAERQCSGGTTGDIGGFVVGEFRDFFADPFLEFYDVYEVLSSIRHGGDDFRWHNGATESSERCVAVNHCGDA